VRCKINFCVLFLCLPTDPRPWRLKILIWRSRFEVVLYIDMVLFLVANCSLIPKMHIFCCLEGNFKCYRLKMTKTWRNLKISYILTFFDLQWLKLTFNLESASNLKPEKVQYWYKGQLQILIFYENFQSSRPPTDLKKMDKLKKYVIVIVFFCNCQLFVWNFVKKNM
jgi:hypothetical protein